MARFLRQVRKAVSPLVAVVLLIAITLAIGGFMSTWLQQITKLQTEEAVKASRPECQYVFLDTKDERWVNRTTNWDEGGNLSFKVINTGTSSVSIANIRIAYENGTYVLADRTTEGATQFPLSLLGGDTKPVLIFNTTNEDGDNLGPPASNISFMKLLTDCPNANIEISGDEINKTS